MYVGIGSEDNDCKSLKYFCGYPKPSEYASHSSSYPQSHKELSSRRGLQDLVAVVQVAAVLVGPCPVQY